jgi:hypothetical protein
VSEEEEEVAAGKGKGCQLPPVDPLVLRSYLNSAQEAAIVSSVALHLANLRIELFHDQDALLMRRPRNSEDTNNSNAQESDSSGQNHVLL